MHHKNYPLSRSGGRKRGNDWKSKRKRRHATENTRVSLRRHTSTGKTKTVSEPNPEAKVTSGTHFFRGEQSPLSNLYRLENNIVYQGNSFRTTEHAYQWAKASKHGYKIIANNILFGNISPKQAMFLGKTIKTTDAWKNTKTQERGNYPNIQIIPDDIGFNKTYK